MWSFIIGVAVGYNLKVYLNKNNISLLEYGKTAYGKAMDAYKQVASKPQK